MGKGADGQPLRRRPNVGAVGVEGLQDTAKVAVDVVLPSA
jgi:hypothetical protein